VLFGRKTSPEADLKDYIAAIPARIGSSRLPRKPLVDICGKTMIERTYEAAIAVLPKDLVYIATDSEEIEAVCKTFGANVLMTSPNCMTGTDRMAEVAEQIPAKTYINLQGDEPLMAGDNIRNIVAAAQKSPDSIINGWAWIEDEAEYRSRTVPKVAIREDGRLMYMSRSPIPGTKSDEFKFSRKQICVYAFPRAALKDFASRTEKTAHEGLEDIEILRFVEMGWEVSMIELPDGSVAVDTPDDLEKVRAIVAGQ